MASPGALTAPSASRAGSVDVFRGAVMLGMIFVNDIAGVSAAPWWLKHYPPGKSGMTVADVVFPAFLFVVGMSIPLALASRRSCGESTLRILCHALWRTLGLLVLGILMVNMPADASAMGWPKHLWEVLVFGGAIAAWNSPSPDAPRWCRIAGVVARAAGAASLIVLASLYVGPDGGWLQTKWWGILGLIGWAYITGSVLYLLLGRDRGLLVAAGGLLLAGYFAQQHGMFHGLAISQVLDLGVQIGSHGAIVMFGCALGTLLLEKSEISCPLARARWAAIFGAVLLCAGVLLVPSSGISKDAATPAWCLISSAITCWTWMIVYLSVDAFGWRRAAPFFVLAGTNALLLYLLHPLVYQLFGLLNVQFHARLGAGGFALGATRATLLTIALVLMTAALNRMNVRLKL